MNTLIRSIEVKCSRSNLKSIRNFVTECLKHTLIDEINTNLIVLAIDEICANKIIHAHSENTSESIKLRICISKNQSDNLVFEIIDHGLPFDPSSYSTPSIHELINKKEKGSLGLIMVHKIMDKVEFDQSEDGNVCKLYKAIPRPKVA